MALHSDFQAAVLAVVGRIENAAAVQRSELLVDAEFRIDFAGKHVSFTLNFCLNKKSREILKCQKITQNLKMSQMSKK